MAMNDLRSRHRIKAGQILQIPTPGKAHKAEKIAASASSSESKSPAVPVASNTDIARIRPETPPTASREPELESPAAAQTDKSAASGAQAAAPPATGSDAPSIEENETVVVAQTDLAADPADYLVTENETIEVQVGETLGHYANWLNVPTRRLRDLNRIHRGQHLIVGKRLRLTFPSVNVATFESKRKQYHTEIQNHFFRHHIIVDVREHVLANGDNLWELSTQTYQVPLWLLRQYNPDLSFDTVLSLTGSLRIPVVQPVDDSAFEPGKPALSLPLAGLN